ncbi:glutathione-regulated potassium-efflux system protein KefB [Vibrio inusitatus NBRC 102082]|uniref:Glutathione-regulated potassium-efflux system protein KefB n=1 Tax=Vibrio inusitatus NBRC 102082 TaxID=1219070 RepID=A0A4Y3HT06_9VIBR|nr:cation:proton antiporter [Vibrio inusitatus]GEA50279.1 glutathione-regulated potassium-efflux system protein KefB [Vibrio inusitatus NBRC 102082]
MDSISFFYFIAYVFSIAGLFVVGSSILGLGTIVGFILAGVALGPFTPGLVAATNTELLQQIADLGVVLFLFTIGLEMKPVDLWKMKKSLMIQGVGLVIAMSLLFSGLMTLLGFSWQMGLVVGAIFGQSSSAVVITLLNQKSEFNSEHGKNIFSNLMGQDLSVVPLMALIPLLVSHQNESSATFLEDTFTVIFVIGLILGIGKILLPLALRWSVRKHNKDAFSLCLFSAIFVTVCVIEYAGLPSTLGAFLLGMLLSSSDFRHSLEETVLPFKGGLMALFFTSVGMQINPTVLIDHLSTILFILTLVLIVKTLLSTVLSLIDGQSLSVGVKTGFWLNHIGEFAFVILALATSMGVFTDSQSGIMIAIVSLSMILSSFSINLGDKIVAKFLRRTESFDVLPNEERGALVIIGMDEVGQLMATMAQRAQIPYIALDYNYDQVKTSKQLGLNTYFGDALRSSVRKKAHLDDAKAVFVSIHEPTRLKRVCGVLAQYPNLDIYARTQSKKDELELKKLGVQFTASTYIESTLIRGRKILLNFGIAEDTSMTLVDELMTEMSELDLQAYKH